MVGDATVWILQEFRSPLVPVYEAAVGLDLLLQVHLDVQQLLVLQFLALHLGPDLVQLLLQGPDLRLDLGQLRAVVALGLAQGAFQRVFLGSREPASGAQVCRSISDVC